jgi:hypothetical protein
MTLATTTPRLTTIPSSDLDRIAVMDTPNLPERALAPILGVWVCCGPRPPTTSVRRYLLVSEEVAHERAG